MPRIDSKLNIHNHVAFLRLGAELTQQQLAEAIGVTRATVIAIEKGDYNPSLDLAFRLARYFGKTIDDVFMVKTEEKQE